ncbi:MAG: PD-(D/E)XK nuclease family protein [Bacteroidota bacterium]
MLAFLEETIHTIQNKYEDLSNCVLILPSKRAGGFLKDYLVKHTTKTIFSPKIISIEEFIEELSGLKIISPEELLIKSYQAYSATEGIAEKESFEDYTSWANALLNDFSEIDRYLVNPKAFFDYLSSIKTLEKWGVTHEQTPLIANYLQFWNNLLPFYLQLNELLAQEQLGYQGMVYRKAAEDIEHYITHYGAQEHIFIGFNALNVAEQQIIQELLETGHTEVLWDIDAYFYNDIQHSASVFVRNYIENWKYYQHNPPPALSANYELGKNITIVEAQNNMAQVKYLGNLLASYSEEKLNNTAIVLADETLLIPVLYSLPQNVTQANITMGVPLGSFATTTFFELLLKLHLNASNNFYYKTVISILHHPLSSHLLSQPEIILATISRKNIAYTSLAQLMANAHVSDREMIEILFGPWNNNSQVALQNCRFLLQKLKEITEAKAIEKLVWHQLDEVFSHISMLNQSSSYLNELSSVYSLFMALAPSISLDFEGDAYSGLQIMGVLETRGLDFENIIMLSVNEGTLPAGKSNASFITYDLKKQFGLPLYTDKDAIYTYHFYRLLHRVQNATLVYNSFSQGLNSGEKSRYLLQLAIEKPPAHHLSFEAVAASVSIQKKKVQQIEKSEAIVSRLKEIAGKYFSPSALTNYVRNPINFYYQKILKISEADEVEETVAYNTLGTIVHNALENLYTPFEDEWLVIEKLRKLKTQIEAEVIVQFKENFRDGDFTKGKNLIIFEVAKRYVNNLVQLDINELKAGNNIKILQLETDLKTKIELPELDFPVYLGGKVDRVDLYNDQVRIIDYKTGVVHQGDVEITEWESVTKEYKYSKAFQILAYALIMHRELSYDNMQAGIISFKNLSSGFLKFAKREKPRGGTKETIISEEILNEFTLQLKQLILEICNAEVPFTEKEITK